jgi:hypothetical protein
LFSVGIIDYKVMLVRMGLTSNMLLTLQNRRTTSFITCATKAVTYRVNESKVELFRAYTEEFLYLFLDPRDW